MRFTTLSALLIASCAAPAGPAPTKEFAVPGTSIRLPMVHVAGDSRLRSFWISTREVTWEEFDRFYQHPEEQRVDGITRPSSGKNYLQLSGVPAEQMEAARPVSNLRWHSAISYCEWLSRVTGRIVRLPTEAEWLAQPERPAVWQYCLEPDAPPDFGPVLRGPGRRTPPAEWDLADPNRPVSTWWFRTGEPQGFRVVLLAEPEGTQDRSKDARRITVSPLSGRERTVKSPGSVSLYSRVSGWVRNDGDRTIDELALKVYALDPKGNPHFEDVTSNLTRRATFNVCLPVLRNGAPSREQSRPLKPGERRSFEVDLPLSMDADADVDLEKFGASVLYVAFGD